MSLLTDLSRSRWDVVLSHGDFAMRPREGLGNVAYLGKSSQINSPSSDFFSPDVDGFQILTEEQPRRTPSPPPRRRAVEATRDGHYDVLSLALHSLGIPVPFVHVELFSQNQTSSIDYKRLGMSSSSAMSRRLEKGHLQ